MTSLFDYYDYIISVLKQKMKELQSVSKCKKIISANNKTNQNHIFANYNIKTIPNLDQQFEAPSPIIQPIDPNQYQQMYHNRDFEDANYTKHITEQIQILRMLMLIVAVISILLSRLKAIIDSSQSSSNLFLNQQTAILLFHTLITFSLLVFLLLKHILQRQLVNKQLIKFTPIQMNPAGITKPLLLQIILLLIHPNYFTTNMTVRLNEPLYGLHNIYQLNDILEIIMHLRVYLIFCALIWSSIYLSTRGNRICRIYGTNCSFQFGMKSVFNSSPLISLIVIFSTLLYTFAEMVRISEKDVHDSGLGNFQNSLWCVMITMGTVGYGDYSPKTYIGRAILFMAAVTGIIISSLLILTLSTDLSMRLSENKAHVTLQRLVLRKNIDNLAKDVMHKSLMLSREDRQQSKGVLKDLKRAADEVKYRLRKIKNIVDMENINEEMDRLFQVLDDNMKQAYENQVKYGQVLKQLCEREEEKINEMKFSFTDEIENAIKDR